MGLLRGTPDLTRRDKKLVGRTSKPQPIEIVAGQGPRVRDRDGKSYIDFQMGWCVGNLGWNPPDIVARVRAFEGPSYVSPNMLYEPWVEYAEQLVDIAPGKLSRAWRVVSGTEAVELAVQLAVTATGRHKLVALADSYHGNSIAAHSIGGNPLAAHLTGIKHLAPPLDASTLDRLETLLKDGDVAAFIMEPVVTNLNVLVPDTAFMDGVVELCHRHGTLVIADEVASAWGRTGAMFACENFDFQPDIMTLAKSITSGVAPLGATLCTNEVARAVDGELEFYSTFGWHPLAVEAGLATLQFWREHKKELLANVVERSAEIRHTLSILDWKRDVDVRIQGLAIGIGVGDEHYASTVSKRCREHGLLIFAEEDSLVMFPPVNVDHETMHEALGILEQAVQS